MNHIDLNIDKCSIVSYHRSRNPTFESYNINGQILSRLEYIRDLGVIFENDLRFVKHIDNIKKKSLKNLGFIYRNTKEFRNINSLKALYYSQVRSVLDYCSILWSPMYNIHIKAIERVQHKFLKIIAFKFQIEIIDHDYLPIRAQFNILDLKTRRKIHDLLFLQKILTNNIHAPELLSLINFRINFKNTRNKLLFKLKKYRTNIGENSPLNRMQLEWNVASDEDLNIDIFFDSPNVIFNRMTERWLDV